MPELKLREASKDALDALSALHPVFQRVLAARGIRSIADTAYSFDRMLPISAIRNLEDAAELLCRHILEKKTNPHIW